MLVEWLTVFGKPSTDRRHSTYGNVKAIPATGRGGPYGCQTSRLPHFLENRLTDGDEDVSLMGRSTFTHQEVSSYSFLLKAESNPSAILRLEGLG
jgi:hypothetical protein